MKQRVGFVVVTVTVLAALLGCARGSSPGGYDSPSDAGAVNPPSLDTDAGRGCWNLECLQSKCEGRPKTTVTGTVYDPAAVTPLYNAIVYVPNAKPDPIKSGASCDRCGGVLSGKPIVTALTDTHGRFVLENVPAGKDIPIVVQIGKWRRQVTVPTVVACQNNAYENPETFRLPRTQAEGDIPLIAVATGCDPMECLIRKVGIDDSEFTNGAGKGRVHLYKGTGGGGAQDSTSAYDFWADETKLQSYDVVINACECQPYPRGSAAYPSMQRFLDKGGRFFGSHYHYNWFTDQPNETDQAVDWTPDSKDCNAGPNFIDDSFPKGKAMAEWLVVTGATEEYGTIPLSCAPLDVGGTKNKLAQGWIFDGPTQRPSYVSFNTPVSAKTPDQQCGRAVFADLHVEQENHGDFGGIDFPNGCHSAGLSPQELALEFMFFDLASCVIDDGDQPTAPPVDSASPQIFAARSHALGI